MRIVNLYKIFNMEQIKNYLEKHGIKGVKEIVYNPTYEQLFQDEMSPENGRF